MKWALVRGALVIAAAGVGWLAIGTSASATQLICLNSQGQFVACKEGLVPTGTYPLTSPATRPSTASTRPSPTRVPNTAPSTRPAPIRVAPAPARRTSPKRSSRAGGRRVWPVTIAILLLTAVSGGLALRIRRRRQSLRNRSRVAEPPPAGTSLSPNGRGQVRAAPVSPPPVSHTAPETDPDRSVVGTKEDEQRTIPIGSRSSTWPGGPSSEAGKRDDPKESRDRVESRPTAKARGSTGFISNGSLPAAAPIAPQSRERPIATTARQPVDTDKIPSTLSQGGGRPSHPGAAPTPATRWERTALPLVTARTMVDRTFGVAAFRRCSQAARNAVAGWLRENREVDAARSAGHYLALGHAPDWSRQTHQRMVQAWRATIEDDGQNGRPARAASRCATLRLLRADLPPDHQLYASALRADLEALLENQQLDSTTIATAVDFLLISDFWLPSHDETRQLIEAITSDVGTRLRDGDDAVAGAGQVAIWLTATLASRSRFEDG
jgi:hypothetical protein